MPVEWIGRARQLHRRCTLSWQQTTPIIEALIGPLRPRPGFVPMPHHARLKALARDWRRLPQYGVLSSTGGFVDGTLRIFEIRATPQTIAAEGWNEPALGLTVIDIEITPPAFRETIGTAAAYGLHSLSRRFERGDPRDDVSVLSDLMAISNRDQREIIERGFAVRTAAGSWIGELDDAGSAALVRTFVRD